MKANFYAFIILSTVSLLKHPISIERQAATNNSQFSSSVWCSPTKFGKSCSFNNLCYNPKFNSFLFILGKRSVISGIVTREDLKEIYISWFNHSHFKLDLVLIEYIDDYEIILDETMLMSSFKPDNIMHVLHDDLLPLFITYKRIHAGQSYNYPSKFRVAFTDSYYMNFHKLYSAFSSEPLIFLNTLNSTVCFSKVHVGLDSDSIFYQYGFGKPQGEVKPSISGEILFEFSEYILNFLKIKRALSSTCTFLARKQNRRILNEKFLTELIIDIHLKKYEKNISLINSDVNYHSIETVIESIAKSQLMLGVHGAGMSLAMFLPRGAVAVEIFPYGILKHVSPLYSMSKITDNYFGYLSWNNTKKENSLWHPEYQSLLGGFGTITQSQKERILSTTFVPPVYCCHDLLYLHFMYQDTYVDFSIVPILEKSFIKFNPVDSEESIYKTWYYPSKVRNIYCYFNNTDLILKWEPPINLKYFSKTSYKTTLSSSKFNSTYVTKSPFIVINSFSNDSFISVWIQCIFNEIEGVDSHFICKT